MVNREKPRVFHECLLVRDAVFGIHVTPVSLGVSAEGLAHVSGQQDRRCLSRDDDLSQGKQEPSATESFLQLLHVVFFHVVPAVLQAVGCLFSRDQHRVRGFADRPLARVRLQRTPAIQVFESRKLHGRTCRFRRLFWHVRAEQDGKRNRRSNEMLLRRSLWVTWPRSVR